MIKIPAEQFNFPRDQDKDVLKSWLWMMSLFSESEWQKRKLNIEKKIEVPYSIDSSFSKTLDEGTLLTIKDDQIGWYLYLTEMFLKQPYKYEFYQGARVIPIFKRFGEDFDLLIGIEGINRKVRNLIKVRKSEADAILFEILTALLWARNGWNVSFIKESSTAKTPDLFAKKGNKEFYIECKRQMKTADYTYRETQKRQVMISHLAKDLMTHNLLLNIVFHVELETLPDTYLKDLLFHKLPKLKKACKISDKNIVDIDVSFVDTNSINEHLKENLVKYNSPQLNFLIGKRTSDNMAFTSGVYASFVEVGEGTTNNRYVDKINLAFGVFWKCDAAESISAKARDIKKQLYSALEQFQSGQNIVIHIGMETYDGPEVEMKRFQKITKTLESLQLNSKNLRWAYCHFFQSYSTPKEIWVFDETVNIISSVPPDGLPPLTNSFLIIPQDIELQNMSHWEKPLPPSA